jgi:hypothetical protein
MTETTAIPAHAMPMRTITSSAKTINALKPCDNETYKIHLSSARRIAVPDLTEHERTRSLEAKTAAATSWIDVPCIATSRLTAVGVKTMKLPKRIRRPVNNEKSRL